MYHIRLHTDSTGGQGWSKGRRENESHSSDHAHHGVTMLVHFCSDFYSNGGTVSNFLFDDRDPDDVWIPRAGHGRGVRHVF